MLTKIGIGSWIGAGIIIMFKGIVALMKRKMFWSHFTLSTIFGDSTESIVDSLPRGWIQANADKLMYDIEIYILLIILGVIMFIVGAFKKA